ncbi:hypothetical protein [Nocardia sp. NPDC050710]
MDKTATAATSYRRVPHVRSEILDCGHTSMIEKSDITGALIRDFAGHR